MPAARSAAEAPSPVRMIGAIIERVTRYAPSVAPRRRSSRSKRPFAVKLDTSAADAWNLVKLEDELDPSSYLIT